MRREERFFCPGVPRSTICSLLTYYETLRQLPQRSKSSSRTCVHSSSATVVSIHGGIIGGNYLNREPTGPTNNALRLAAYSFRSCLCGAFVIVCDGRSIRDRSRDYIGSMRRKSHTSLYQNTLSITAQNSPVSTILINKYYVSFSAVLSNLWHPGGCMGTSTALLWCIGQRSLNCV